MISGVVALCPVANVSPFTSQADARQARSQDFYTKTVKKMAEKDAENAKMAERIKEAKHDAKVNLPKVPEAVLQDDTKDAAKGEKSVAGRKKMSGVAPNGKDDSKKEVEKDETKEEHEVEEELNAILKRSPSTSSPPVLSLRDPRTNHTVVIIFSKSYCPHSARAKGILLEKYKIVPSPYVVELDEHKLGPGLQDALLKATGRRTVPNVLISGRSIGGGDDVAKLDEDGELIDKIKKMGGKRIMEATLIKGS